MSKSKTPQLSDRKERLAQALRANLQRRKQAARSRQARGGSGKDGSN